MYRIKNTADDRTKAHLHRTATKFIYEPTIAGRRLRLGETRDLTDEEFAQNEPMLRGWEAKGMISIEPLRIKDVNLVTGRTGIQEAADPVNEGTETAKFPRIEDPIPLPTLPPSSDSGWTDQEPRAGTPPAPVAPPVPSESPAEGPTKKGPGKKRLV